MEGQPYRVRRGERRPPPLPVVWDAEAVRALRRSLELSQRELAQELGVRQQTVSEWETGSYRPRGGSRRLLSLVAERAGFAYRVQGLADPPPAVRDTDEEVL